MKDKNTFGNYTTRYIRECDPAVLCSMDSLMFGDGGRMRNILSAIRKAEKFYLPDNGDIFDDGHKGVPENPRLPFKEIVIEYTSKSRPFMGEKCGPRILYAREVSVGDVVFGGAVKIDGILVVETGEVGGRLITNPVGHILAPQLGFLNPERTKYQVMPFVVLPGAITRYVTDEGVRENQDEIDERIRGISAGVWSKPVWELIEALSCRNVRAKKIEQPRLRKAGLSKGREFFDYHVLTIDGAHGESQTLGGSHASPRFHLRRGHIRRHPTAGNVWVNACTVGDRSIGSVAKDYRIAA